MSLKNEAISIHDILDSAFAQLQKTPPLQEYIAWRDWQDRIMTINEPIADHVVDQYILPILRWNKQDEGVDQELRKPITIYLNTPGGDVIIGLILAEVIVKSVTPVHVVAIGDAASMGSIILMSGHKRFAYEFSNVLIHDGSIGISGSRNKVKDGMKFYEQKDQQLKNFILEHTEISEEKLGEMERSEWWLTASEALQYGIIDSII